MGKSQMIQMIQEIVYYLRIQNYHEGCMRFRILIQKLQEDNDVKDALKDRDGEWYLVITEMLQALQGDDLVLLADLLEGVLLPMLQGLICEQAPIVSKKYQIESSVSGYLTVRHLGTGLYLHSNGNPMEEARQLVRLCYDPQKEKYAVWGAGLGYHIACLYEMARGSVSIDIFDEDEEILQLAKECDILKDIPLENIKFVLDEDGTRFVQSIRDNKTGVLLHFPSVKKIENDSLREALHHFFADWNGTVQLRTELEINFRKNQANCNRYVDELQEKLAGKSVVIVGAGPSLDDNLEFLRKNQGTMLILSATTVWKKLIREGIVPDYFVVMDSQMRTFGHMDGVERKDIPLIVDSTACWRFAESCEGDKYLVYQYGFDESDRWATKRGVNQYETGGTVITLAMEIVLKLGAKEIFLVGVDLAYPDGVSHAGETMDLHKRDLSGMKKIKSVTGNWVCTDTLFDGYRMWIENKLSMYPHVECHNMSTCGAWIKGTISRK